jgi:lysyl-tRNA synthetase class 2
LCVGGVDRLFELNRNFRNEGADATHNPEFTALELYQAHADYDDMRAIARDLVLAAAVAVHGRPVARPQATATDVRLDGPWPCVTVHDAVSRATGVCLTPDSPPELVRSVCSAHHVAAPFDADAGHLIVELYEALVEPATTAPTFYTDFPIEVCPLARGHRRDPRLAERWDLVAFGMELATANSELTDPVDQRMRLAWQSRQAAAGDAEAMELDEDFLAALEHAMPPTGGLGLGVDRLVMLLTGRPIRGTLAFPFVRPLPRRPVRMLAGTREVSRWAHIAEQG